MKQFLQALLILALLSGCDKKEHDNAVNQISNHPLQAASSVQPPDTSSIESSALPTSHPVIDVWELRREVAKVEPLVISDNTDACFMEGDPEHTESKSEIEARRKSEQACVDNIMVSYTEYQHARDAFNKTWLPIMMDAIAKGDLVAEVIMRQCSTTPIFDRSGIESSCDEDTQRRNIAAKRLREIGFAPAFDLEGERAYQRTQIDQTSAQPSRREIQQAILEKFRLGVFSIQQYESSYNSIGNLLKNEAMLEEIRNHLLIDAAMQDVRHAFTFSTGRSAGWHTDTFNTLKLNRSPQTPGYLTWGRKLYYGGLNSYWGGMHYWRSGPYTIYLQEGAKAYESQDASKYETYVAYSGDSVFINMLRDTLAAADMNINRYLAQDKRWAVFMLHRVGLHEWVPEGIESDSGKLGKEWQGKWVLDKTFVDWKRLSNPVSISAIVYAGEDITRIQFSSNEAGINESACELRFSGGKTYLPGRRTSRLSSMDSPLGYLSKITNVPKSNQSLIEPFAPLDPSIQYPQVLIQCPQGEWPDTERVRFLLLANDTLIEVLQQPESRAITIRHFKRAM